jgi:hypothetical protein
VFFETSGVVAYTADGDNYSLTDTEMETLWHKAGHKLLPEIEAEIDLTAFLYQRMRDYYIHSLAVAL